MTCDEASLVIVGRDQALASRFASAILGRELSTTSTQHSWEISTKYYDAWITVHVASLEQPLDRRPTACIMVVKADELSSMLPISAWWEINAPSTDSVQLLAVLGSAEHDPDITEAQSWCVDQLIELVAVPRWLNLGELGNEGMSRVREALEAHMWPGLKLKQAPRPGLRVGEQEDNAANRDFVRAVPSGGQASVSPIANPFMNQLEDTSELDDDEAELQQLERAFRAASGIQAQLRGLEGADRHVAAEQALMGLLNILGLDDASEESTDDEDAVNSDSKANSPSQLA